MVLRSLATAALAAAMRLFAVNGAALCPIFIPLYRPLFPSAEERHLPELFLTGSWPLPIVAIDDTDMSVFARS